MQAALDAVRAEASEAIKPHCFACAAAMGCKNVLTCAACPMLRCAVPGCRPATTQASATWLSRCAGKWKSCTRSARKELQDVQQRLQEALAIAHERQRLIRELEEVAVSGGRRGGWRQLQR